MNPCHKSQLPKLNRAAGQVEAVKRMVAEGQYCVDIMTQLRAARSALKSIELAVLETHMHSCLDKAGDDEQKRQANIEEILKLLKKYQ